MTEPMTLYGAIAEHYDKHAQEVAAANEAAVAESQHAEAAAWDDWAAKVIAHPRRIAIYNALKPHEREALDAYIQQLDDEDEAA